MGKAAKKERGRPSLKLPRQGVTRFTEEEYTEIAHEAVNANLSISLYLRSLVMKARGKVSK